MKKRVIVLGMLMVLLLVLSACSRQAATDNSYTIETVGTPTLNENGEIIGDCHYEKLVFTKPNESLSKINSYIDKACSSFFESGSGKDFKNYLSEVPQERLDELVSYPYKATMDVESIYLTDSYVSIKSKYSWYCGGVGTLNYLGNSYDLDTGEPLQLTDLLMGSEDAIMSTIKNIYWSALIEHYTPARMFDTAREVLDEKALSDYAFFIGEDGEIFFIVDTYEFAPGAEGSYAFGSGLSVGDTCYEDDSPPITNELLTGSSWRMDHNEQSLYAYVDFFGDGTAAVIYHGSDFWMTARYSINGDTLQLIVGTDAKYTLYYDRVNEKFLGAEVNLCPADKNEFITWIELEYSHFTLRIPFNEYLNSTLLVEKNPYEENSYILTMKDGKMKDGMTIRVATIYEYENEPTLLGNPTSELASQDNYKLGYYQTEYDALLSIGFATQEDQAKFDKAVSNLQFILFGSEFFEPDFWVIKK